MTFLQAYLIISTLVIAQLAFGFKGHSLCIKKMGLPYLAAIALFFRS